LAGAELSSWRPRSSWNWRDASNTRPFNKETSMRVSRPILSQGCALWGAALLALPGAALANADVEKNIANPKNWAMQAGDSATAS
jgi:hypothetical protein